MQRQAPIHRSLAPESYSAATRDSPYDPQQEHTATQPANRQDADAQRVQPNSQQLGSLRRVDEAYSEAPMRVSPDTCTNGIENLRNERYYRDKRENAQYGDSDLGHSYSEIAFDLARDYLQESASIF